MISVTKLDNVWMEIQSTDRGTLLELQDFFSFQVPGFQHKRQFQSGAWDGKIKLFNPFTSRLYIGLLPYLQDFADLFSYEIEVDKRLHQVEQLPPEELNQFVDGLRIHKKGKPINPRYYQKVGLYQMINAKRTTLVAPTAAGKSLMCYMFAKWFFDQVNGKIALIVPTTNLVEQMASDFDDYSQGAFGKHVHKIYSGKDKNDTSKAIYVTTWQSVYELPEGYFNQFDAVIIDECHGAQASSLKGILEKCQAPYRIGMTGTMHQPEAHKWVIEGLLGKVMDLISLKELMERKWVTSLKINCITFDYPPQVKDAMAGAEYHDEIKYLVDCQERTDAIVKAVGKQKENSFLLFDKIDMGKAFLESCQRQLPNRKAVIVYGVTKTDVREEIRKALENESGTIVIASYKVFSMGISVDNLFHVFFGEPPGKSQFRIFQSIGRTLRLYDKKIFATLWDFSDKLVDKKGRLNHTLRHFVNERIPMYNSKELPYTLHAHKLEAKV